MAKATILLSDEDEGFELAATVTFEPEIPEGQVVDDLPAPYKAAFAALDALNEMSPGGVPDYIELNDDGVELHPPPGHKVTDLFTEGGE